MEIWKDVFGYEGCYQISDLGRVKSMERMVKGKVGLRIVNERILKPAIDIYGYRIVSLSVKQKVKKKPVHLLVAKAFLNHTSNGKAEIVIDHINNLKKDNKPSNLQVISHRKNCTKDQKGNYSKFIGVSFNKAKGFYRAMIRIYPDRIFLGISKNEEYCSRLYQMALKEMDEYDGCKTTFRNYIKEKVNYQGKYLPLNI